jgi:AcrR family transcriptional regulator
MERQDKTVETRERLLEAAGEVFAQRGFRDATIREICEKAKANVAAAHYHFGDKEELYAAVFDYARRCAVASFDEMAAAGLPAEERLGIFVRGVLTRFFDEGRPAWLGKLLAQEMIEPTRLLDSLVTAQIRPNSEVLKGIVRELIGRGMDEQELWRCTFSVAAQWVFYFHNRQIVKRLNPDQRFSREDTEELAHHIVKFSMAALKAWKKGPAGKRTSDRRKKGKR